MSADFIVGGTLTFPKKKSNKLFKWENGLNKLIHFNNTTVSNKFVHIFYHPRVRSNLKHTLLRTFYVKANFSRIWSFFNLAMSFLKWPPQFFFEIQKLSFIYLLVSNVTIHLWAFSGRGEIAIRFLTHLRPVKSLAEHIIS